MEQLLTAKEIAPLLNCTTGTVYRLTREQRIPFFALGERNFRYDLETVRAAIAREVRAKQVKNN